MKDRGPKKSAVRHLDGRLRARQSDNEPARSWEPLCCECGVDCGCSALKKMMQRLSVGRVIEHCRYYQAKEFSKKDS